MITPEAPTAEEVQDALKTLRNLMISDDPYEPLNGIDARILARANECLMIWHFKMNNDLVIEGLAQGSESTCSVRYQDGKWTATLEIKPYFVNKQSIRRDSSTAYVDNHVYSHLFGYTEYQAVKEAFYYYEKAIQRITQYIADQKVQNG
jgi:hypothetical protein